MKKKKMNKEERERYRSFLKQMKRYEKRGVEISVEGEEYSLEEMASVCAVQEQGCYMGDYIWGDEGKLAEIRYKRINLDG